MTDGHERGEGRRRRLTDITAPVVDLVLDTVDPDDILDRVDVNALLDRVDVDALLDRVDVDRLMARVDVADLVERAGVADIVRASTQDVAGSAIDAARRYAVGLDVVVTGALRRLLRRDLSRFPAAPPALLPGTVAAGPGERTQMTGRYAGLVTRLLGNALDAVIAVGSFVATGAVLAFVLATVFGTDVGDTTGPGWVVAGAVWSVGLLWASLATTGRTPGGALLGLRVVARDGRALPALRSLVRVVVLPLSAAVFGLGYLGVVVGRERRALHDVVAGSTVVYDWGDEPATVPTPLDRWMRKLDASDPGRTPA